MAPPPKEPPALQLVARVSDTSIAHGREAARQLLEEVIALPSDQGGLSIDQLQVLQLEWDLWARRLEQYALQYQAALDLLTPFMLDGANVVEAARRFDATRTRSHERP